jgi:hypothetical protein
MTISPGSIRTGGNLLDRLDTSNCPVPGVGTTAST